MLTELPQLAVIVVTVTTVALQFLYFNVLVYELSDKVADLGTSFGME